MALRAAEGVGVVVMRYRALFALLLPLLLFPLWAGAAEYFVRDGSQCANNGNGSSPSCAVGSGQAGALRNVSGFLGATFSAGDTVYICDTILLASSFQPAATAESGSAGNPIIIDGNCPVGDGTYRAGAFDAQGAQNYAFRVTTSGPSYWTLRNLTFKNAANDCMDFDLSTSTGWTLEAITIEDCAIDGLDVNDLADSGISVDGVYVYRAAGTAIACTSTTGGLWQNLYVYDSGTAGEEANNDGLALNDGCGDGKTITDVWVYRQKSDLGAGIDLQDSSGTGTVTLRKAYIEGGDGAGYTSVCNAGTQTFDVSTVIVNGARLNVYLKDCGGLHKLTNFTTYGGRTVELKLGDGGTSGDALTAIVKNSSFGGASCVGQAVQYRDNASVTITTDNNQYCPGGEFSMTAAGTKTFTEWQTAASQDANSIEADPLFLGGPNPTTAEGFRPAADSPLCRAGTPVLAGVTKSGRRLGSTPDIGAVACRNTVAP